MLPQANKWKAERSKLNKLLRSERKMQILKLLADGHDRDEIAELLGIAPGTVKNHICGNGAALGIIQLLSARNKTHAVAIAIRLNILA